MPQKCLWPHLLPSFAQGPSLHRKCLITALSGVLFPFGQHPSVAAMSINAQAGLGTSEPPPGVGSVYTAGKEAGLRVRRGLFSVDRPEGLMEGRLLK